jgi:cytochrome oxidase assembly protein ShyY1
MTPAGYAYFDMALSFGVVLALGVWQLHSLKRGEQPKEPPKSGG